MSGETDWIRLVCTLLIVAAVLLPVVRSSYWIFRILEYPRFQKLLLCITVLASWAWNWQTHPYQVGAVISLAACTAYLLYKIWPYTPFSRKEMKSVSGGDRSSRIRIFTANVYERNRDYKTLIRQVHECDPDLVFLVETDAEWMRAVDGWGQKYPHSLAEPLGNTYGLLLYSKLPFREAEVRYLVEPDVPSVKLIVELASGQRVAVTGLHPKPPVPGEDERTTAKDKELMLVAEETTKTDLPVIMIGDLNDVAWSYTTELFRKTARLLDPRRGRGFYSTFNAKNPLMRFPLDYIFCSNDFGLVGMRRLPKNGSDHFPMFIELQYDPALKAVQKRPAADSAEREKAHIKRTEET